MHLKRHAVACLLLAFALVAPALAQATRPSFEVAAINRSAPNPMRFGYELSPSGQIHFMAVTAKSLVSLACEAKFGTVFGEPHWAGTEQFDIEARIEEPLAREINALPPLERSHRIALLVRTLLEERFQLKIHTETKELPIYALVVARGGPRLKPAPPNGLPDDGGMLSVSHGQWHVQRMSMLGWASNLSVQPEIGRIVVDETGLKDSYDFDFKWSATSDEATTIFTALEEQLGLKLVSKKAPVETYVVDHVEEPSAN